MSYPLQRYHGLQSFKCEADEDTKELFYTKLAAVVDRRPGRYKFIVMGDLNAKVRDTNEGYKKIKKMDDMNDNRERSADFYDLFWGKHVSTQEDPQSNLETPQWFT